MNTRENSDESRDGIALVLVLGILSILLILGVAFATALRTEQLATRNSIDSLRARQLVDVAINEALDAIDLARDPTLGDGDFQPAATSLADLIFVSGEGTGKTISKSELLNGPARSFLPPSVIAAMEGAEEPRFIEITPPPPPSVTLTAPAFTGQVAYLVADVSSYIDGSLAGGLARNHGTNVGEIVLFDVGPSLTELTDFVENRRDLWGEFDTRPDIMMLAQPHLTGDDPKTNEWMMPYSYFPMGYWHSANGVETPHFDVRPDPDILVIGPDIFDLEELSQAIRDSDIDPLISDDDDKVRRLAANIRDYLDDDNIPGNKLFTEGGVQTASICTEAVPMINEVRLLNQLETRIEGTVTNWYSRVRLDIEVWFPFEDGSTQLSDFEVKLNGMVIGPVVNASSLNYLIGLEEEVLTRQPGQHPGFEVFTLLLEEKFSTKEPDFSSTRARVEVAVEENGGDVVDHLIFESDPGKEWKDLFKNPTIPPAPNTPAVKGYIAKQADDPRINWDWLNAKHWTNIMVQAEAGHGSHSLGRTNDLALTVGSKPEQDDDTIMFVRNGLYRSPGELGNLLYDEEKPWQTIRLLGPDPDRTATLVEHFAARDTQRGFVNLNNALEEDDVLAAVFMNSPVRRYPDEVSSSVGPMLLGDAYAAANAISNGGVNGGGYTNRSDLARHITAAELVAAVQILSTEVEAENLISDAYNLLGTRQNLFIIIAVAQTFAPKSKVVTAERRAVALVWRDPLPNKDDPETSPRGPRHTTFVRNVVWLNE